MKFRRFLILFLAFMFCFGAVSNALAAKKSDPNAAFLKDLKSIESYLKKNAKVTNLADKAEEYVYKNFPDFDKNRLSACLTRFLGCSETVPLKIKLASYAAELNGSYRSISDTCKLYGITPEEACDKNFMERSAVAAELRDAEVTRKHKRRGSRGTVVYGG